MSASAFEAAARAAIATRLSPRTREVYARVLAAWTAACEANGHDPLALPPTAASDYREALAARLAPASVRQTLATLSFIYGQLLADELVARNPFSSTRLPRPPATKDGKTEVVPAGVGERMIAAAEEGGALRDATILRILNDTGMRRISVASIRRDRLSRNAEGRLVAKIVTKGSSGEVEKSVFSAAAAEALERWFSVKPAGRRRSHYAFPGRSGKKPVCLDTINRIIARWGAAVGVPNLHPHCFRASFITAAFDANVPWRDIQESVHHKDPRSTQRYDRGRRGEGVAEAVAAHRRGIAKDKED